MFCGKCGKQLPDGATFCGSCGTSTSPGSVQGQMRQPGGQQTQVQDQVSQFSNQANQFMNQQFSGTGVPEEIKGKLNWGAFLLGGFWSIAHSTWLGLLCFVPYVNVIMAIVLLVKGNEMAWQNRRFNSVAEFQQVQRAWMLWGIGITIGTVGLVFLGVIMGAMAGMAGGAHPYAHP